MSGSGRRPAPRSRAELQVRAAALGGCTVAALAHALGQPLPAAPQRAKGFVGQLVELALGADPQAYTRPDFPHLQVELKTIPLDARGLPAESTFCCAIAMQEAQQAHWHSSRLRQRLGCVLWIPVQAAALAPLPQRRLGRACLWTPTPAQSRLLQADWEQLMGMVGAGQAAALDARLGTVLQVRPKAAHAGVRTLGQGPDGPEAVRPLGFYLRPSFTAQIVGTAALL